MSDAKPDVTGEAANNVVQQLLQSIVVPELECRIDAGLLPKPYPWSSLRAFQILFSVSQPLTTVRINDEIVANVEVATVEGHVLRMDAKTVLTTDVVQVRYVSLLDQDANKGHATFFRVGLSWEGYFSFVYNQGVARRYLRVGRQFLDAAKQAAANQLWPPFLESLFAAHELAAKAYVLCYGKHHYDGAVKHTTIKQDLNWQRKVGNVEPEHAELYNQLYTQRGPARYAEQEIAMTSDEANRQIDITESLFVLAERYASMEDNQ